MQHKIRPAKKSEASALTALAFEAKAYWSYPADQLEIWRHGLTVLPEMISSHYVYVAVINKKLAGFFVLNPTADESAQSAQSPPDHWSLDLLFVSPSYMHRGIGRDLLLTAARVAACNGARAIHIDSDPNAEAFYLACSAVRTGSIAAPVEGDAARVRPQMLLTLY